MKALSLWQPWASLVAVGEKLIETRGWTTKYRGTIAIHAAQIVDGETVRAVEPFPELLAKHELTEENLPRGAIVAIADLIHVVPVAEFSPSTAPMGDREFALGDYSGGRYAWVLSNVRPLATPVPWQGQRGLFEIEESFVPAIMAEIAIPEGARTAAVSTSDHPLTDPPDMPKKRETITEKVAKEKGKPDPGTADMPLDDKKKDAEDRKPREVSRSYDAHDRDLIARSMNDRIETLEALAKKARDEGYEKEARAMERDAAILREQHLPVFQTTQVELQFGQESDARNHLKKLARQRFTELLRLGLGITDWIPNKMQTTLISEASNTLAGDLLGILLKCTREARAQGKLDRTVDEAAIVEQALRGITENAPK